MIDKRDEADELIDELIAGNRGRGAGIHSRGHRRRQGFRL